jgi:hypothetical protein
MLRSLKPIRSGTGRLARLDPKVGDLQIADEEFSSGKHTCEPAKDDRVRVQ